MVSELIVISYFCELLVKIYLTISDAFSLFAYTSFTHDQTLTHKFKFFLPTVNFHFRAIS